MALLFFYSANAVSHTGMYDFWHIWLADLLAYFCFDMSKRHLQRVDQVINHLVTMKWPGGQS